MSEPTFGISINRIDNEPRPAVWSDMSVVGLVGTAPAADPSVYPLNTVVFLYSDDTVMLGKLGATGTLPDAVDGINDQLGEFQVAARIVVVRVSEGADTPETIVNLAGSAATNTGIHALTTAGPVLGMIPRLVAVPGYTRFHTKGLSSITITDPGADMTVAPGVVFSGGGSDPGKVLPTAVAVLGTGDAAGSLASITITDPGANLTAPLTVSFTGGGTSPDLPEATATLEFLANPVCAELPAVLAKLLAVAVIDGPNTSQQAFLDWRETLQSERLISVASAVKVGTGAVEQPASPRVLGIAVRRDHEFQGRPFHSWANQRVQGIVGPNRPVAFSLTDGATEGQTILAANGGVIVRGELGVETAIASGGYVYVGTDTCSEDTLWQFYNVVRGRDYIHLMFLRTLRFYLGRFNINGQTVQAVLNTIGFALRDLKAQGDILGYEVKFTRDQNAPEQLRQGRFTVNFAAEEAPVLRYLAIQSARYRPALDALLDDLLAQVGGITG